MEMPLPVDRKELRLGEKAVYPVVVFDGICHIIAERSAGRAGIGGSSYSESRENLSLRCIWRHVSAEGYMVPVVYVKETDSMVWESSCGSGSMGAAVYFQSRRRTGSFVYRLHQPGGVIEASVCKENGKVISCKMGDPR